MGTIIDLSKPSSGISSAEEAFSRVHFDTEIIHLQNFDNYYSLMDRLSQRDASGQALPGILLVWPARGKVLQAPAEFGKLRGWCVRHGYRVGVVIPRDDVHLRMAKEQGLAAFRSVKEASVPDWSCASEPLAVEVPDDRVRRLALLRKDTEQIQEVPPSLGLRLLFFLLAVFTLAGAFYAILPQARVEITPYLTTRSINMNIWTDDRLDAPSIGGGIPTASKRFELSLQAEVPASGSIKIEPGIAVGEVTVRNRCNRTQTGAMGTVLSTTEDIETGIRFQTLDALSVPPGAERNVRIEAMSGGVEANLPAGSIRYASYPLSQCWEISQSSPTAGGTDGTYPAPIEMDRAAARQLIISQIPDAVAAALQNDPDSADLLPLGDPVIVAIRQEQVLPESGFASETLTLRQTLEVSIKTVRRSDIETIIRGQSARLNAQTAGLTGYEILSGPVEENGILIWSVRAEYLVYEPETNEEALQIMLRGKSLPQARAVLATLEHVKETRITLLPSWLGHMPLAAQNIHVIIHTAVEAE